MYIWPLSDHRIAVYTLNGVLTWIGRGFGIYQLTIQLVLGYIFYPLTFFMGVPRAEIYRVSQLLATKLVANEFVAYLALQAIRTSGDPLTHRAEIIAQYALCGFANLASLGIQIGVLSSLGPARGKSIARLAPSAMLCGFLSTMQAAGIAYVFRVIRRGIEANRLYTVVCSSEMYTNIIRCKAVRCYFLYGCDKYCISGLLSTAVI